MRISLHFLPSRKATSGHPTKAGQAPANGKVFFGKGIKVLSGSRFLAEKKTAPA
jgi:hypothetical protein